MTTATLSTPSASSASAQVGFVGAADLARAMGCDLSTIHRWCRRGFVAGSTKAIGPGRQPWLIPISEYERLGVAAAAANRRRIAPADLADLASAIPSCDLIPSPGVLP